MRGRTGIESNKAEMGERGDVGRRGTERDSLTGKEKKVRKHPCRQIRHVIWQKVQNGPVKQMQESRIHFYAR